MSSITVNAAATGQLREALYGSLTVAVDELSSALLPPDRESSAQPHAAYIRTAGIAGLLDRAGWREQDRRGTLAPRGEAEARLILDALSAELAVEADKATDVREHGEDAAPAEQRCAALHDALCAIEAAAGLLTFAAPMNDGGDA